MSEHKMTLNRVHKVLERIAALRNQSHTTLVELIGKTMEVKPSEITEVPNLESEATAHFAKIEDALMKMDIYDQVIQELKANLVAKNVELGINSLIARLDCLNKSNQQLSMAFVNYTIRRGGELSGDHAKLAQSIRSYCHMRQDLCKTDTGTQDFARKSFKVPLVSTKGFENLEQKLKARKVEVDRINDQIAALNGTQVVINLPDSIAEEVGLIG